MVHLDNGYYGHRRILCEYARPGRGGVGVVLAAIQHGWTPAPERITGVGWPTGYSIPRLFWSPDHADRLSRSGMTNAFAVGAPWIYLHRMVQDRQIDLSAVPVAEPSSTGTVALPYHSSASVQVDFDHTEYGQQLWDTEGGSVLVVLHPIDALDPTVADAYRRIGHSTATLGADKFDPAYLLRQYRILGAHQRVVSNRLGTASWYGVHLGLEAALYGPEGTAHVKATGEAKEDLRRVHFNDLIDDPTPAKWRAHANTELGVEAALEREEIAEMLGLIGRRSVQRRAYSTIIGSFRAAIAAKRGLVDRTGFRRSGTSSG